jgi:hypothetical protein
MSSRSLLLVSICLGLAVPACTRKVESDRDGSDQQPTDISGQPRWARERLMTDDEVRELLRSSLQRYPDAWLSPDDEYRDHRWEGRPPNDWRFPDDRDR